MKGRRILYRTRPNSSAEWKAQIKLYMIDASISLNDLRIPPGNRLHSLTGDFLGYHSISINMQWRIIFKWNDGTASEVKITNYHK